MFERRLPRTAGGAVSLATRPAPLVLMLNQDGALCIMVPCVHRIRWGVHDFMTWWLKQNGDTFAG